MTSWPLTLKVKGHVYWLSGDGQVRWHNPFCLNRFQGHTAIRFIVLIRFIFSVSCLFIGGCVPQQQFCPTHFYFLFLELEPSPLILIIFLFPRHISYSDRPSWEYLPDRSTCGQSVTLQLPHHWHMRCSSALILWLWCSLSYLIQKALSK